NATRARTNAAMSTLISYQRKHPRATELLLQRAGIHCALLVSVLGNVTVRCRRTTGLKLIQLGLEQGLQTSAVFALVGTKLGDTVFQRGLLGLDRGHNFVVLLGSFCLKCSSLILSLTDLRLSTGLRLRLGLLRLSFSIRHHLLGAGIRLRQLGGRTGLGVSQLLLRSLTCLRQHGVRLRACLIGQAVCHILGKAQDASSLHVGFWSCCAGGAGSSTCGSAGGGSGSWSSRRGSLGRLQLGVFLLRSFEVLLGSLEFLANLSGLILSSLNLSGVICRNRCSSRLRGLGLISLSLSLGCFFLGLVDLGLGICQLLFVFCAKFGFNGLAYGSLVYSRCSGSSLGRTRAIFNLLLKLVVLILELG